MWCVLVLGSLHVNIIVLREFDDVRFAGVRDTNVALLAFVIPLTGNPREHFNRYSTYASFP